MTDSLFNDFNRMMSRDVYKLPLSLDTVDLHSWLSDFYISYKREIKSIVETRHYDEIDKICISILDSIHYYYNGSPQKAFNRFSNGVGKHIANNGIFYSKNTNNGEYSDMLNLYRVRKISAKEADKIQFSKADIFHVPFSKRRLISSCRFSIAGYPCLYLGTSVNLCRIESGLKLRDNAITALFKMNRQNPSINIRVLDLGVKPDDVLQRIQNRNGNVKHLVYGYLKLYPVLAACSVMVNEDLRSQPFKPEYIVPQLLMQWLLTQQNENSIAGIRYFTCRSKDPRINGYNYVFPVIDSKFENNQNYCSVLRQCFRFTDPVCCKNFGEFSEIESYLNRKPLEFL